MSLLPQAIVFSARGSQRTNSKFTHKRNYGLIAFFVLSKGDTYEKSCDRYGQQKRFRKRSARKKTLDNLGIAADVMIMSAHRTPKEVEEFSVNAETDGYGVIIAAAGKAAHLAGVIAANTVLPVIGIPMKSSTLDGLDSLLSTVQMPSGIPVATVAISGSENAALLAAEILAVGSPELTDKLKKLRIQMKEKILSDNEAIQNLI